MSLHDDQIIGELHPMTCGACGSVLADVSKPCGACGWIVETITDRAERLQKEVEELAEWKAEEQRFLVKAASKPLVAGYKGEGILDGIMWLIEKAKAHDDFIAAILALEPHMDAKAPHVEALLDKVKESRKLRGVVEIVKLRCQYILGVCRGEEEMKAEARGILDAMEKGK